MVMTKTREEIIAETKRLKAEYGSLFDSIAEILFTHDPIGINFETNTDEYELEARTIIPRLRFCYSADDALLAVHEEFQHWFGSDITGPKERYEEIAAEIWQLWQKSQMEIG
jgi:hypothetical protein